MECFYQLVGVSMLTEAYGLTAEICRGIAAVAGSDDDKAKESIVGCVNGFSNAILDTINEMHEANDLDGQLTLQRAIVDIYVAFLPLAPYEIRVNIIIISCNIGAILYWQKKDYAEAYEAYRELTRLVEEKDLAAPDKNGRYMDQANARLADVYIRSVVCLEKLGREEELKALIGEAESRAGFIAEHTNALRGDAPYILYTIFSTLVRYQSPLAPIFLLKAFDAIRKDDYDRKAHPKTVRLICEAIQQLRGAANGESD